MHPQKKPTTATRYYYVSGKSITQASLDMQVQV